MKRILLLLFVLMSLCAQAQTEDEPQNDKTCYDDHKFLGLQEKNIDLGGKVFTLMTEGDFAGENIILCDKEELLKLCHRISSELFVPQGKYDKIVDWKSMKILFGNRISTQQAIFGYLQEGSFHLLCYGLSDQNYNSANKIVLDGKEIDAMSASKIILKEPEGYDIISKYSKRPLVVVIHACGAGGKSRCSFASRLSRYLAKKLPIIYVVAAPGNIHPSVSISTWPSYTETVIDDKGIAVSWNCFHKGKFVSEGEKDFATTIVKIQNEYLR